MFELELSTWAFIFLLAAAFGAGFIDSVAGGGGLIQLPALVLLLPQQALPVLFGTNKLASIAGTSFALYRYSKGVSIRWKWILPSAAAAFVGSFLGANFVAQFPRAFLEIAILILLFLVSLHTFLCRNFGLIEKASSKGRRQSVIAVFVGFGLGFYDGFFGPGTGGFLIFLFILFLGMSFLQASAASKVVNVATNLAALIYFLPTGHVLLSLGVCMAGFNVLGAYVGSRMALKRGSVWVRNLFLVVVILIQLRLAWQILL